MTKIFLADLQYNVQNGLPQHDPQDLIRDMQFVLKVEEGSTLTNYTLYSVE